MQRRPVRTRPAPGAVAQDRIGAAERAENFPVALSVLPARLGRRLRAVYAVLRVIDDLGDEPGDVAGSGTEGNPGRVPAERLQRLAAFRADLDAVWADPDAVWADLDAVRAEPDAVRDGTGPVRAPVLRALAPVVREVGLSREPFTRLVEANVVDQRVTRYRTRAELSGYCALSAEPVGRIVLELFGVEADDALRADCDAVCTALQLLEHWRDVGEDRRRGRVYLPADDLRAAGVADADLDDRTASPALRRLIVGETRWALAMLRRGERALARLHGWARVAVAGYVAGGRAAADALLRADGDVLVDGGAAVARRRRDVLRHLLLILIRANLSAAGRT